jgi:RNA polymerase sigma-70 factor (ECF subfamily)
MIAAIILSLGSPAHKGRALESTPHRRNRFRKKRYVSVIFCELVISNLGARRAAGQQTSMDPTLREATRQWTTALPTVSAFVTSLVRDFQQRDEILQETAVAVMESFHRYDPSKSFIAWAIGIARNQAFLLFRDQKRRAVVFDAGAIDALAQAFLEKASTDERLDHLADCLDGLEQRSREMCRLRYELDLKPAAIGERLGMAANAVAKALQRIRDRLRQCIERKTAEAGA